jgi:hypothetical protein
VHREAGRARTVVERIHPHASCKRIAAEPAISTE